MIEEFKRHGYHPKEKILDQTLNPTATASSSSIKMNALEQNDSKSTKKAKKRPSSSSKRSSSAKRMRKDETKFYRGMFLKNKIDLFFLHAFKYK